MIPHNLTGSGLARSALCWVRCVAGKRALHLESRWRQGVLPWQQHRHPAQQQLQRRILCAAACRARDIRLPAREAGLWCACAHAGVWCCDACICIRALPPLDFLIRGACDDAGAGKNENENAWGLGAVLGNPHVEEFVCGVGLGLGLSMWPRPPFLPPSPFRCGPLTRLFLRVCEQFGRARLASVLFVSLPCSLCPSVLFLFYS